MKLSDNGGKGKAAPETINDRFSGHVTNPFLGGFVPGAAQYTQGGITGPQPQIYLDNYAKQQQSPIKAVQSAVGAGTSEIQRLLQEREGLMHTGCYSLDDPLIQELDRQIRASQLRAIQ